MVSSAKNRISLVRQDEVRWGSRCVESSCPRPCTSASLLPPLPDAWLEARSGAGTVPVGAYFRVGGNDGGRPLFGAGRFRRMGTPWTGTLNSGEMLLICIRSKPN